MAIDPSIFFQGAALQQANAARTQATMDNLFNRFAAQKQRQQELEQQKATDYEGSAYRVLMAQQAGQQPDPQDLLRAQAWDKMQSTKVAVDPVTGNVYNPRTSLFDNMAATPSTPYKPQYAPPEAVDIENLAPMLESQLTAPYPAQANVPLPPRGGQGVDMERIAQARIDNQARLGQPALPMPSNPKQAQEYYGAKLELGKRTQEADIEASQAGAKKRAELTEESSVSTEQRNKALKDISTNIDNLIAAAEGTPSGMIEGAAASVSSALGFPNKQAIARAKFESGKAISGLQSRIAFLKGQGTITDAEAKQAMAFIPDVDDPIEIKKAKLTEAKLYISGLVGEVPKTDTTRPGFKYLGTE